MTRENTTKNTYQEGRQRWLRKVLIKYTSLRDDDPVTTTYFFCEDRQGKDNRKNNNIRRQLT